MMVTVIKICYSLDYIVWDINTVMSNDDSQ